MIIILNIGDRLLFCGAIVNIGDRLLFCGAIDIIK
jgi:hypothetical protein